MAPLVARKFAQTLSLAYLHRETPPTARSSGFGLRSRSVVLSFGPPKRVHYRTFHDQL